MPFLAALALEAILAALCLITQCKVVADQREVLMDLRAEQDFLRLVLPVISRLSLEFL